MASIFKREPSFSHKRLWDDSTKLPENILQAATKLNWSWYMTFSEFENVLAGSYKTAWREVAKDHFSDESNIIETLNDEAGFYKAVRIFVCTILDSETPRDVQYVCLAPCGDHRILKDLLTAPRDNAH